MRRIAAAVLATLFAVSLSGCATARKQHEMEVEGLKNQISALEAQVQSKDEEINGLRDQLLKAQEAQQQPQVPQKAPEEQKVVAGIKSRPTTRNIQIALTNAGYNVGKIDGRMGKQTRDAIEEFQKANNLPATGKVDKRTWELLRAYLHKKIK